MENLNVNGNLSQGDELDDLKKIFESYQKGQTVKKKSKEEILSKYFVPRKDKEYFRPLPPKGKEKLDIAFFHVVPTNFKGGKKRMRKLYCPAHNDPPVQKKDENGNLVFDQTGKPVMVPSPCPMCDKYKYILSKQSAALKNLKKEDFKNLTPEQEEIKKKNDLIYKEATKWQAKKFYILRGVDKGVEKDGVKFWRFKFNFKKQGVFDKLTPVLIDFGDQYKVPYYDPNEGTDLSITVIDAEFMGRTYRDVSAISSRGKSKLHEDPLIAKQWLDDPITWRDVFKPAVAPNITSYEYLKMAAKGEDPYWDDSDANNKHWVFPNHPDLEAKANTRDMNLDATAEQFEYANDVDDDDVYNDGTGVNISNISKADVTTYNDSAVNITAEIKNTPEATKVVPSVETKSESSTVTPVEEKKVDKPVNNSTIDLGFDPNSCFDDLPF